jgi:hypothetical protein
MCALQAGLSAFRIVGLHALRALIPLSALLDCGWECFGGAVSPKLFSPGRHRVVESMARLCPRGGIMLIAGVVILVNSSSTSSGLINPRSYGH